MIELLRPFAHIIVSPIMHIPIMLFVGGWLISVGYKKMGAVLATITIGWYLLSSTTVVPLSLAKWLENQYPPAHARQVLDYRPQAIVVLACYFYEDDLLPIISQWPECSLKRLLHAYWLHRDTGVPIIVTGGGIDGTHTTHAREAGQFLARLGVEPDAILAIAKGTNTQREAAAVEAAGFNKIVLVTTAVHMPRSVNEFERVHIDVLASPTDHLSKIQTTPIVEWPNAISMRIAERVIHEYVGLLYQRLRYGPMPDGALLQP